MKVRHSARFYSGNAEAEANHPAAIEGAENLPADFVGNNKQTQRQQLDIVESPNFTLQPKNLGKLTQLYELPYLDLIDLHPGLLETMAPGTREDIVRLGGKMFSQSKDDGFRGRHQRPITMAAGSIVRLRIFRARTENLVD